MDKLFSAVQMRVITVIGMIVAVMFSLYASGSLGLLVDRIKRDLEPRHPAELAATLTLYDHQGVSQQVVGLERKDMMQLQAILKNVKGD